MLRLRQCGAGTRIASILVISLFAGLLHLAWSVYRDLNLRRYHADVIAPLTARSDAQWLYQYSPFRAIEIKFPPGEMHIRYQLRIWDDSGSETEIIRENLHRFLKQFYEESPVRFETKLMAAEIEPVRLRAIRTAKQRQLAELLSDESTLRWERIEQLTQEVRELDKQILEQRILQRNANSTDQVILSSFVLEPANRVGATGMLRSLLVVAFVAMLQLSLLWSWR